MGVVLAVDIGGTKMAAGLVDRAGRLTGETRIATPTGTDAEVLFSALTEVVDEVRRATGAEPEAVGVGCGGPMEASGDDPTVSPLNIGAWRRFPLARRLAANTGLRVAVDNDAKALVLGEGWVGAAAGERDHLAMVVSTGGARGCLEAEASGTAIAAVTGRPATEAPAEVRARTGTLVGRAVASVANLLDLRLACVAGSVALGYGAVFLDAARAEVAASSRLDFSRGTEIRFGALGADGPLIGAGAVGWRLLDES